ncbi:MAG: DUF3108 domain-containing protein [Muribaculaceae bacterium]|nr:DUF3108 domain-containing protein [Muribaculaceae bacterium]
MKKLLIVSLMAAFGVMAASAQYCCTEKGKVFLYKMTDLSEKTPSENVLKTTILEVQTAADGNIDVRVEDAMALPDSPLSEIKTNMNYLYDAKTDVTTVVMMNAEDFRSMIVNTIKESAQANGQYMSAMELADLEKMMSTKGSLELVINPNAEVGSKIPNSTLRLNAGQMTMTMNVWEGKFLGSESVTTDAGTFDCVKISYVKRQSTPEGNEKANVTAWYAKGIGLVKEIETDKKGNVKAEQSLYVIKEPKAE